MSQGSSPDRNRQRKRLGWRIWSVESLVAGGTVTALILGHGVRRWETVLADELGVLALVAMILLSLGVAWRCSLSRDRVGFVRTRILVVAVQAVWLALLPVVALTGLPAVFHAGSRLNDLLVWSEFAVWMRVLASMMYVVRYVAAARGNPAVVFVASFGLLILIGTLLLMLPICRVQYNEEAGEVGAPPLVALFTATSASCVTGLTLVDTGTYWSRTGQAIILALIQLGGLGVMTFGAFFALGQRRGFLVREGVFMGKLMEADDATALRGMITSIFIFTFASEALGAVLLSTMPTAEEWPERGWFGLFHSVSSFCNAGFSLLPRNLEGCETRWQVGGVIAPLIILGGLGFDVLRNVTHVVTDGVRRRFVPRSGETASRPRLTATSRLVLGTTLGLLITGMALFFLFEAGGLLRDEPLPQKLAHSWFQSVTFRTAGFNTVEFSRTQPTTRLVAIGMMFIGASPGSTGGGIKTVVFSLMLLATAATVRGSERLEIAGRTISHEFIRRGAAIVAMALGALLTSTLLVAMFEQRGDLFLDHLFETTSALGTVGLSSVGTSTFRPASQLVIAATMFIGRVGPLTILVALTRPKSEPKYSYPSERVMLG